jgi:4-hydroxybenzoate polyprenyltransferase
VLAAGGGTLADTGHLVLSVVTIVLMFAAMAFGAAAFGLRFHLYTIATIVIAIGLLRTQKESASRHRPDRVAQQPKLRLG